jgi:hypothetical protein
MNKIVIWQIAKIFIGLSGMILISFAAINGNLIT